MKPEDLPNLGFYLYPLEESGLFGLYRWGILVRGQYIAGYIDFLFKAGKFDRDPE
jgi:hypothetical protein